MTPQIVDLRVQIVRFVMDHQPSIVACEVTDAQGHLHTFVEKCWMLNDRTLDQDSEYPQAGAIRCMAMETWSDDAGQQLVKVNTADPDMIESTEGVTEIVVLQDQVSAVSEASR